MPSMTLNEIRRKFEASFRESSSHELEETMLFSSVSDELIRGTSNPTAVSNGSYQQIFSGAENNLSADNSFEDFLGKIVPFLGSAHEKVQELDSISQHPQSYLNNEYAGKLFSPFQTTVRSSISFSGIGLHSGKPSTVTIEPASADFGIWFRRMDILEGDSMVPARWVNAGSSQLSSSIRNQSGVSVNSVERLLAAIYGCGISNLLIEIDGPEVPVLDGSALGFVRSMLETGVMEQASPRRIVEVQKPVEIVRDGAFCRLEPFQGLEMRIEINFSDPAIGHQQIALNLARDAFVRELCDSRTFCRLSDLQTMQASGLALGCSLENCVVVDGPSVLNPDGLRYSNEAVRYKMLETMGDLALAGTQIAGRIVAYNSGHMMMVQLLQKVFADPFAYSFVENDELSRRLPGIGEQDSLHSLSRLA